MEEVRKNGRRFSVFEKQVILRQYYKQGVPLATLARRYNVSRGAIYKWKTWIDIKKDPEMPHGKMEQMLAELEKLRSENQILKKSVQDLSYEKTCSKILINELKKSFLAKNASKPPQKRSLKKSSR